MAIFEEPDVVESVADPQVAMSFLTYPASLPIRCGLVATSGRWAVNRRDACSFCVGAFMS